MTDRQAHTQREREKTIKLQTEKQFEDGEEGKNRERQRIKERVL